MVEHTLPPPISVSIRGDCVRALFSVEYCNDAFSKSVSNNREAHLVFDTLLITLAINAQDEPQGFSIVQCQMFALSIASTDSAVALLP